ncbi:MarC family protein [Desulfothermus sp.]
MLKEVLKISIPLFLIMDPFANSTACLAILKDHPSEVQQKIIFREMLIALFLMIIFQFFGSFFLNFLSIDKSTLRIAGGIILFIISLKLIFPEETTSLSQYEKDPFIVPIATPFIAGPSLLAAIMLYAKKTPSQLKLFLSLFIAWLGCLIIMLSFTRLKNTLKDRGTRAIERLMGLILILLAVQMLEEGIKYFLETIK